MTLTPEEVAERLVDWVHLLGPLQEAKGLTLNAASGLSATVHIDGDRHAVVPKLLDDVRAAASLIRSLAERVEKLEKLARQTRQMLVMVRAVGVSVSIDTGMKSAPIQHGINVVIPQEEFESLYNNASAALERP